MGPARICLACAFPSFSQRTSVLLNRCKSETEKHMANPRCCVFHSEVISAHKPLPTQPAATHPPDHSPAHIAAKIAPCPAAANTERYRMREDSTGSRKTRLLGIRNKTLLHKSTSCWNGHTNVRLRSAPVEVDTQLALQPANRARATAHSATKHSATGEGAFAEDPVGVSAPVC